MFVDGSVRYAVFSVDSCTHPGNCSLRIRETEANIQQLLYYTTNNSFVSTGVVALRSS